MEKYLNQSSLRIVFHRLFKNLQKLQIQQKNTRHKLIPANALNPRKFAKIQRFVKSSKPFTKEKESLHR